VIRFRLKVPRAKWGAFIFLREFGSSAIVASPQPLSKGEGLRKAKSYAFCFKVLSFGEDLGEAQKRVRDRKPYPELSFFFSPKVRKKLILPACPYLF